MKVVVEPWHKRMESISRCKSVWNVGSHTETGVETAAGCHMTVSGQTGFA